MNYDEVYKFTWVLLVLIDYRLQREFLINTDC